MFPAAGGGQTTRPRGTDFMKSPEMLANGHLVLNRGRADFDRRKHDGAGVASDMWSLGCLLYHLVFGEMLFFDPDYMRFLNRITFGAGPMYPPPAEANLASAPVVARLLGQLVLRDPTFRQTADKVQVKLEQLLTRGRFDGDPAALPAYAAPTAGALQPLSGDASRIEPTAASGAAPRAAESLASLRVPMAAAAPAAPECVALEAPPGDATAGPPLLQVCEGVLLAPDARGTTAELAAAAAQYLVVVTAAGATERSKERWLRLAAALETPCVFANRLQGSGKESAASLRELADRLAAYGTIVVAYETAAWPAAAAVTLSLVMARLQLPAAHALLRLKRCAAGGDVPLSAAALAHSAVC